MRILYVTTTFPVYSETFLQREVRALRAAGAELIILSLHKGDAEFEGMPVRRVSKLALFKLCYLLPMALALHGRSLSDVAWDMTTRRPASFLNLLENLLGLGAAIVDAPWIRRQTPAIIHCVWGSAPAAYGLLASRLCSLPFSMGAHAYDVFEHGGDWLLKKKADSAALVHVSTDVVVQRLAQRGILRDVVRIRRGLNKLPSFKTLRPHRRKLRIISVARLVEKKGVPHQIAIYGAMADAGIAFEARIVGDGPMGDTIKSLIEAEGLSDRVKLLGRLDQKEVALQMEWSDLLFHTGIVARSGDRDGLPNVVPEAMAAGVVVVGSPVSGVVEAIEDGVTGFLLPPWEASKWADLCHRLQRDDALANKVREAARAWTEAEFLAERNSGALLRCLRERVKRGNCAQMGLRDTEGSAV